MYTWIGCQVECNRCSELLIAKLSSRLRHNISFGMWLFDEIKAPNYSNSLILPFFPSSSLDFGATQFVTLKMNSASHSLTKSDLFFAQNQRLCQCLVSYFSDWCEFDVNVLMWWCSQFHIWLECIVGLQLLLRHWIAWECHYSCRSVFSNKVVQNSIFVCSLSLLLNSFPREKLRDPAWFVFVAIVYFDSHCLSDSGKKISNHSFY